MLSRWVVLVALAAACGGDDGPPPQRDAPAADDVVVYVVRHAETTGIGTDPSLDATGQAHAQALATRFGSTIKLALASQYKRTQETAMPSATAGGVSVTVVPVTGTNAATYGNELMTAVNNSGAKFALIVGHSNTVPDTVKAFTGVNVTPIAETEYNRLFTITLSSDGPHLEESTY